MEDGESKISFLVLELEVTEKQEEAANDPCDNGLELGTSVWTHF